MPSHPLKHRLSLAALPLALLIGAACGGGDTDTQKGVEDTSTTTGPESSPSTTATTAAPTTTTTAAEEVSYANCDEAKAAGVAPITEGQPGYRTGLDRDGDGIACDK